MMVGIRMAVSIFLVLWLFRNVMADCMVDRGQRRKMKCPGYPSDRTSGCDFRP